MSRLLPVLLLLSLALSGCGIKRLLAPSPAQRLSALVAQHPELVRRDTVHDTVRVVVPRILVQTRVQVVRDTVRERRDSHLIDSLLWAVGRDLSDAQHVAARSKIWALVNRQPPFPDTLRADTLGIHLRIWIAQGAYQIHMQRDPIVAKVPVNQVREVLAPSGQPAWYADRHIWLIIGLALLCALLLLALIRR